MSANKKIVGVIIVLVIVFVVVVAWAMISGVRSDSNSNLPGVNNTGTTQSPAEKKAAIMKSVSNDKALSQTQKDEIYKLISGDQVDTYNFTKEEKLEIIRALNR